jgi:hypothetical protein
VINVHNKETQLEVGKLKNQVFGIEIELTGITRERAAKVIAQCFESRATYKAGIYKQYEIKDSENRIWKVERDSSIRAQRKSSGRLLYAGDEYRVEIVSPKCKYKDIQRIQEIVRLLRKAGAIVNRSCGIHIHIDAANHNEKTLRNLVNIFYSKQDLIYRALGVEGKRESDYCRKLSERFVEEINNRKPKTLNDFSDIWYKPYCGSRSNHYHSSRYHGLNLHATFTKGTIEFRIFNSTTHAGKIKAYIQFCLAISHQAMVQKSASKRKTITDNEKYTFRTWLLRLGLIGDEFKTCRTHLLSKLKGNIAFRHGRVA